MATFDRCLKVAIKLPRSAVWEPKLPMCWKPAMKLPRSAVWDHSAEKRPWNCQSRQFENMPLIMDRANGWKAAVKLPRLAIWGPKALKCWKPTIKLPRSLVWERGHESAEVGGLSPWKKVWFKLPRSAVQIFKLPNIEGLPKCNSTGYLTKNVLKLAGFPTIERQSISKYLLLPLLYIAV